MASGKQVPVFVGLLIYLRSWLSKVGRKNFNTVVEMRGTAAALSYSRASRQLEREWRELQCTESLSWKNREENAKLDSFKFLKFSLFSSRILQPNPSLSICTCHHFGYCRFYFFLFLVQLLLSYDSGAQTDAVTVLSCACSFWGVVTICSLSPACHTSFGQGCLRQAQKGDIRGNFP